MNLNYLINPLRPTGSSRRLDRQTRTKSAMRTAVFVVVFLHTVFFAGLLVQGCRRNQSQSAVQPTEQAAKENWRLPAVTHVEPNPQAAMEATNAAVEPKPAAPVAASPLSPALVAPPASAGQTKEHTVVKGETLFKIARDNHVSPNALAKANPKLNPSKLVVGQKIQVPVAGSFSTAGLGFVEPGKTVDGNKRYVVKPGETLNRIAREHRTTVKAIQAANRLNTTRLVAGQKLILPEPAHAGSATSANTNLTSKVAATTTNDAKP
jgi:N-acetylmuramoyl-L-alanine amidase